MKVKDLKVIIDSADMELEVVVWFTNFDEGARLGTKDFEVTTVCVAGEVLDCLCIDAVYL